jgi:hypothetical protein
MNVENARSIHKEAKHFCPIQLVRIATCAILETIGKLSEIIRAIAREGLSGIDIQF